MTNIQSWQTWRKKNNPKIYVLQDSTLGYVQSVEPTLRQHGFLITEDDRDLSLTPKADALTLIDEDEVSEVVYWVWKHSRGYCSKIIVAYKRK